jgi:hypothetical protein
VVDERLVLCSGGAVLDPHDHEDAVVHPDALHDPPDEERRPAVEHRQAVRARVPVVAREAVSGGSAQPLGEGSVPRAQRVDRHVLARADGRGARRG